jgi:uncharacterized protein
LQAEGDASVPALRVIAPNGASDIPIASMHIPFAGLRQPSPTVLDGAKRLVIEHLPEQSAQPRQSSKDAPAPEVRPTFLHTGHLPHADWANTLTREEIAEIKRNASCNQMSPELTEFMFSMRSPALADATASSPCARPGLQSRDQILQDGAVARGLSVVGLETQAAVERQRKTVPDNIYFDDLHQILTPEGHQDFGKTVAALNSGDYEAILTLLRHSNTRGDYAELQYRVMVAERNQAWMPLLRQHLDEGDAVIVVGAGHLPGPDGLENLLERDGYKIQSILLPPLEDR